ncbi:Aste57867_2106 [Aphanomyces stellatus]|uniref:Aste57867_2106 protein n=1 Tax=Aphanomyces stellatus TaxID=120398 RepID=A0A485K6W5_9STRA|nr:hypothetical protein As57867_002101 [Aphanomyces stellatus]VFT79309.1 Aste57867_2106 [Aphanomyces stellatus]
MPLPSNFFKCPPLTAAERQHFKQLGIAAAYEVAEKTQLRGGPITWELNSDEGDLRIYKGVDPNIPLGSSGSTAFASSIEVVGTMDEAIDLFRSQTTEQAKEYCRRFGNLLTDAVNLYSIVPATDSDQREMIGISWRSFKAAIDKVVAPRDACILDVHHAFQFNGRRVWVRLLKSVELACCPDLQAQLGFVRMHHEITGHIFMESTKPGYLHIGYIAQTDVKGVAGDWAGWLVDMSMKKRCRNLSDIDRFLRENRLSKTPFMTTTELMPITTSKRCFLCVRRFGPLGKRLNCLKCGEVHCRRCIQAWHVKNRGFDAIAEVCNKCALGGPASDGDDAKSQRWRKSTDDARVDSSTDFMTSDGGSSCREYIRSQRHVASDVGSSSSTGWDDEANRSRRRHGSKGSSVVTKSQRRFSHEAGHDVRSQRQLHESIEATDVQSQRYDGRLPFGACDSRTMHCVTSRTPNPQSKTFMATPKHNNASLNDFELRIAPSAWRTPRHGERNDVIRLGV